MDELRQKFCCSSGLCVSSIKTGTRRIMRPDELPFVVRCSRRISKESSFRRIMRLVPVFILEKTNYKCLPKLVQSDNVSIKTAIDALSAWTDDASSSIKMAIEEEAMSLSADAFALFFFLVSFAVSTHL